MDIGIILIAGVLVGVTIFIIGKPKKEGKREKDLSYYVKMPLQYTIDQVPVSLKEFQKKDKDFDPTYFSFIAFCLFREVQEAWSNRNLNKLKSLIGERLFETYEKVITNFIQKGQKNVIQDLMLLNAKICSVKIENNKETIQVLMMVSCYDYLIATSSHRLLSGNSERKLSITYLVEFERTKEANEEAIICSNCKQLVDKKHAIRCPFCNQELVPKSYDFIITNKVVLKETEF